jgi:hypothetical protein
VHTNTVQWQGAGRPTSPAEPADLPVQVIWTTFNGDRGTKSKPIPGTTSGLRLPDNGGQRGVRADPSKAMPVILTTDSKAAFENVWLSRDSHLEKVPGFVEFHLLKGPEAEDHTPLPREIMEPLSFLRDRRRRGPTGLARSARRAAYQPSRKMGCATHGTADKALSLQ